jgi:hypothetical protein
MAGGTNLFYAIRHMLRSKRLQNSFAVARHCKDVMGRAAAHTAPPLAGSCSPSGNSCAPLAGSNMRILLDG